MSKRLAIWNLLGNSAMWIGVWFGDGYPQSPHFLHFFPINLPLIGTVWLSVIPMAIWVGIVHPRVSEKIGLVHENPNAFFKGKWIRKKPNFDAKTEAEKWRLKE